MKKQIELETLQDIKNMMQRSSRFISLSGWSGVAAGCCALAGAAFAFPIVANRTERGDYYTNTEILSLLFIAGLTFVAALSLAFLFTYLKSKKNNISILGNASKRLAWSFCIPFIAGGIFLIRMIDLSLFGLVAPGCLIVYGVSLFSASKQTLDEIKYLGYAEIIIGIIALWNIGYGFYFWTVGFGLFHILYGIWMWYKYERK